MEAGFSADGTMVRRSTYSLGAVTGDAVEERALIEVEVLVNISMEENGWNLCQDMFEPGSMWGEEDYYMVFEFDGLGRFMEAFNRLREAERISWKPRYRGVLSVGELDDVFGAGGDGDYLVVPAEPPIARVRVSVWVPGPRGPERAGGMVTSDPGEAACAVADLYREYRCLEPKIRLILVPAC